VGKTIGFLKKEFLEMLPPTLFFFVVFCLVVLTRDLMFQDNDAGVLSYAAAALGALIIGKSVLIADALPLWRRFDRQPKVALIVGRTVTYSLIALLFQFLEEFIPLARSAESLGAGFNELANAVNWPRFWGTHIQLLVLLGIYNIIAVLAEELGRERFIELLLGKPDIS
jgi:membrane protease YdiL (CAAX protease family)